MEERQILLALQVVPMMCGDLVFLLLLTLVGQYQPQRMLLVAFDELGGLVVNRSKELEWYQRQSIWLEKNGADFHYGKWVNPLRFLCLRIVLAAVAVGTLAAWKPAWGVVLGALFYGLPGLLLRYLNRRDNERMLPEIKLLYHALEIQIRAGVYVTDAMAECYGSVKEPRLRQALLELASDIVMKADIYEALNRFQGRFDNRYIDSLCITLCQALESGQAVELLGDIAEQIKDMEETLMERRKVALDRSITFYQLGILAAVLGVVLYACVTQMLGAAMGL